MPSPKLKNAIAIFKQMGGILRMSEAIKLGIHRRELYTLRDRGDIELVSRGLFRLTDIGESTSSDYIPIAKKVPEGVICLTSALIFHQLTTQIPRSIHVALPHNSHIPMIKHPPMRFFWFSERLLKTGIEEHTTDACQIKVYNIEKTLIDCLKFRNKIGMDLVLEAFRLYWERRNTDIDRLFEYAKMFKVERVLKPLMEILTCVQQRSIPKRIPVESISQDLKTLAMHKNCTFHEILHEFAIERFLYRLSLSRYAHNFLLKAGFAKHLNLRRRLTLHVKNVILPADLSTVIHEVFNIQDVENTMSFRSDNLTFREVHINNERGIIVNFYAEAFNVMLPMHIELRFHETMIGEPEQIPYSKLLQQLPSPKLMSYPVETEAAEKLESIIKLGMANTQMQDFYDVWILLREEKISKAQLKIAIKHLFSQHQIKRQMPIAFTETYYNNPQTKKRWQAFLSEIGEKKVEFSEVVKEIATRVRLYFPKNPISF